MAAFAGLGISNALVQIDAPELPIMDGSSAPFIYLVQEAGVRTLGEARRYIKLTRPVTLTRGDDQLADGTRREGELWNGFRRSYQPILNAQRPHQTSSMFEP